MKYVLVYIKLFHIKNGLILVLSRFTFNKYYFKLVLSAYKTLLLSYFAFNL